MVSECAKGSARRQCARCGPDAPFRRSDEKYPLALRRENGIPEGTDETVQNIRGPNVNILLIHLCSHFSDEISHFYHCSYRKHKQIDFTGIDIV